MKDLRTHVSRRVIVETDSMTVEGVIARLTGTTIELENVILLTEGAAPRSFDGVLVIPSDRVAWVQVP
ncbi:hypothetical protein ASD11_01260 [Aeromicrobium sp. Root495]|uniref:hypothetical protein n=1 Tax=Aeromicrobium sp. Root495 TaxID=1736550 RepID=UPI0006FD5BBB|nr:hypothetical protein [Aeromicrobium sp. Root495]KQY58323.1 hypothetical protein ASD11_01260 [Aeromicrobium sp. Root495]